MSASGSPSDAGGGSRSRLVWLGIAAIVIVALIGLWLWRRPASTTDPDTTPTSPAVESTDQPGDSWSAIESAGSMTVGTSADYPPFAFYRGGLNLDGFDVALMRAIGQHLGVAVQFQDYEFSGIGSAVLTGEIDAAIAAITVTPDRGLWADFSDGYFTSSEGILASADASLAAATATDLAGLTVGVQEGSVYATWAGRELVEPGLVERQNVKSYTKATDLPAAVLRGEIDVAVLDLAVADSFAQGGDVKVVGSGLSEQRYAIAAAKGAGTLVLKLNEALAALDADGTMERLAEEYEIGGDTSVEPIPPMPPAMETPETPGCVNNMAFVQHINLDDQGLTAPQPVDGGQPFVKSWRVMNTGTCTWTSEYSLQLVGTNTPSASMGGQPVFVKGEVLPGQTYDFSVNLVAPVVPGLYVGFWSMADPQGVGFGQRITVAVTVSAPATLTPVPTQTPSPSISFEVDKNQIKQGECVKFKWSVENIDSVYFYREGDNWQDNGVEGKGSRTECPRNTTQYNLRVVFTDGTVETRSITIYVETVPDAPVINLFSAVPDQITEGQCVTVQWAVSGDVNNITVSSRNQGIVEGAPMQGSISNCPSGTGSVDYTLDVSGPGGTQQVRDYVNVVAPSTATPAPTPPPDMPIIELFTVLPPQATVDECVNVQWSVAGGVQRIRIYRDQLLILDNPTAQGLAMDCPGSDQPMTYTLEVLGRNGQTVIEERFVNTTVAMPHQGTP